MTRHRLHPVKFYPTKGFFRAGGRIKDGDYYAPNQNASATAKLPIHHRVPGNELFEENDHSITHPSILNPFESESCYVISRKFWNLYYLFTGIEYLNKAVSSCAISNIDQQGFAIDAESVNHF